MCAAGPLGTSGVLRALSMQVWPAASSCWPATRPGPADLDSNWVLGRGPYLGNSALSSLVDQRERERGFDPAPGPSASEALGRARARSTWPGEAGQLLAPPAFLVRWVFEAWAGPFGGSSLVSLA